MNVTVTEDPFVAHRGLLFTVSYEMLGSAADAEDVVQRLGCGGTRSVRRRAPRYATRVPSSCGW